MRLLEPGQTFAERYRVENFLASGGMGAVFVAMHLLTEMRVALKVLRPELLSGDAARERFELEARVAARVKSEHIVKVLDAGTDAKTGLSFLVMELLEGKSLEQLVEELGPLPPGYVVGALLQVADGLDLAHRYSDANGVRRPIVHRDLKPENLFILRYDSPAPLVKILDFGIAKVLSETGKVSQELKGTPLYMAYEQATGQAVTPATDVWALGLIAFYSLTGRSYWKSLTLPEGGVASLFSEILSMPMPPASDRSRELGVQRELPPGFDQWFARCIDRRPEHRFESASGAIQALQSVLGVAPFDETLKAHVPTARNFRPPSLPTPVQYEATISADAMAKGGSTTGTLAVDSSPSTPKRVRGVTLALLGVVVLLGGTAVLAARLVGNPEPSSKQAHGSGSEPATTVPSAESETPEAAETAATPPPAEGTGTPAITSSVTVGSSPLPAPTTDPAGARKPETKKKTGFAPASGKDPYDER